MILYFSGTGNSEYVANIIAEKTDDEIISINKLMKTGTKGDFNSAKPYVLVCPTYAWRVPLVVEDYLRTAKLGGNGDMYFILTCGSSTAGASSYAKKLCDEIGKKFRGLRTVVMPENYIALFDVPDTQKAEQIVKKALPVIEEAAENIKRGDNLEEKKMPLGSVMSAVINKMFFALIVKDKGFHLEKDCISCGKCVESCPLNNIALVEGKPRWGGNCTHCMACICGCPNECIEYKNASRKRRRYWFGR